MTADVQAFAALPIHGLVFGALDPVTSRVSVPSVAQWIVAAVATALPQQRVSSFEFTFHRAIDHCDNPVDAIDTLAELGVHRVLSSGGASTALQGCGVLADMIERAKSRLVVACAAGVNPANAAEIIAKTNCRELHGSCLAPSPSADAREASAYKRPKMAADDAAPRLPLAETVMAMLAKCNPS